MNTFHKTVTNFFEEILSDLKCQQDTKSYIISIYGKYKSAEDDLSKDSVTLLFAQARNNHDFLSYQKLADWLFFINSVAPEHLNNASKDYYDTIAKLSYYSCYKLINKQWKLFEQLADEFVPLTNMAKKSIELSLNNSNHRMKF